jgi:hypothetical protein
MRDNAAPAVAKKLLGFLVALSATATGVGLAVLLMAGVDSTPFSVSEGEHRTFVRTQKLLYSECPILRRPENLPTHRSVIRYVLEAERIYGVDHELLLAVIANESRCHPNALSHKGAVGLMQLHPATARHLGVSEPRLLRNNILAGSKYLSKLLGTFDQNLTLALAAYNAGPATVKRYRGIPPYNETRSYVKRVMKSYRRFTLT